MSVYPSVAQAMNAMFMANQIQSNQALAARPQAFGLMPAPFFNPYQIFMQQIMLQAYLSQILGGGYLSDQTLSPGLRRAVANDQFQAALQTVPPRSRDAKVLEDICDDADRVWSKTPPELAPAKARYMLGQLYTKYQKGEFSNAAVLNNAVNYYVASHPGETQQSAWANVQHQHEFNIYSEAYRNLSPSDRAVYESFENKARAKFGRPDGFPDATVRQARGWMRDQLDEAYRQGKFKDERFLQLNKLHYQRLDEGVTL